MRRLVVAVLAVCVPSAATAAPPPVRAVSLPRTAVVGRAWQATLRASAVPTVVATGPSTVRAKATHGAKGVYRVSLTFPRAGTWRIAAGKTRLGSVEVDVARDPLLTSPFTIAAEPSGALLVGQRDGTQLVRVAGGRASSVASGIALLHVTTAPNGAVYVCGEDGAVYRVDGATLARVTPPMDASSAAVDGAGNIYVSVYLGWIKKIATDGTVTTIAGNGTEGYSGDGGPAVAARIFHPHSVVLGRDGALYVADTENRRLRRIDLATGTISSFGGDVGITVALAVGPDGSIYSSDVVRDGAGGGLTRTTPQGVTTRIASSVFANGVAVAPDGTVYANLWELKRIQRVNATGTLEPVARG